MGERILLHRLINTHLPIDIVPFTEHILGVSRLLTTLIRYNPHLPTTQEAFISPSYSLNRRKLENHHNGTSSGFIVGFEKKEGQEHY